MSQFFIFAFFLGLFCSLTGAVDSLTDFEENLIAKIMRFIDEDMPKNGMDALAKQLRRFITEKREERDRYNQMVFGQPAIDLTVAESARSPLDLFMSLNDEEIARQMTLIDFTLYAAIESRELLNQAWSKEKLKYRAPHVVALMDRLNKLSYWIPSLVLSRERLQDRKAMWLKLIKCVGFV